jgi:Bacteriophage tail sheath protein
MPVALTYPGVYVEEISSGVHTITGVATSITAFVGRALRGPADQPVRIQSFADFVRQFGGLSADCPMSYAVQHFFAHGGGDSYIVRVAAGADAAKINLPSPDAGKDLVLVANGPGEWGNNLRASVSTKATKDPANLYTLTVQLVDDNTKDAPIVVASETILNLSSDPANPRYVNSVLADESSLVAVDASSKATKQVTATVTNESDPNDKANFKAATGGDDGNAIGDGQVVDVNKPRKGVYALDAVDLFNILCIPPLAPGKDPDPASTLALSAAYCRKRRAMLIVDAPAKWKDAADAEQKFTDIFTPLSADAINAALYFPRLVMPDPLQENRSNTFAACGAVAGIYARTDANRGVWKAPAGIEASFSGLRDLAYRLDNDGNGRLNPHGVNCLRSFPTFGSVVWGARTLAGADQLASEWKYVPVRRTALYIEESLYRGTQWVVFEPNDEPLWAQIRLNVGAFMHDLFRQGAFQGTTPKDAYFVKCDKETTTQNDIDHGVVNILVGFAPLKPAEFVVIQLQQMAGQIQV